MVPPVKRVWDSGSGAQRVHIVQFLMEISLLSTENDARDTSSRHPHTQMTPWWELMLRATQGLYK